jgi:zinc transport system substrate-binding protein
MTNRYFTLIAIIIVTPLLFCGKSPQVSAKPIVAVSIPPQKYFVQKIAGDLVTVLVMVPPGSSPHTYEPKPAQMAELSNANLYFAVGIEFEKAWLERLAHTYTRLKVISTDSGIEKISERDDALPGKAPRGSEEAHSGHSPSGLDPHIWLSPELVKMQTAAMTRELCAADPRHAPLFRHNNSLFIREIKDLQDTIKRILAHRKPGTPFMVFHPAWGYFAKEFGLTEVAIEVEGKEPSPREMTDITDAARRDAITTIYVQPQFSQRTAEIIAREIGAKVAVADDLSENWAANLIHVASALEQ